MPKKGRPPRKEPPHAEDIAPRRANLAEEDLASIAWKQSQQGTWYMKLDVECLSKKLLMHSMGYGWSPFGRIAKLAFDDLIRMSKSLGGPATMKAYVIKYGTSDRVAGEEFVKLTVIEKDRLVGTFVAPLALFKGCSRAVDFGLRRSCAH